MLKQAQKLCREQAFIWGWWKWACTACCFQCFDPGASHSSLSTLACCRPHESVTQEQEARDPVHTLPEAQPITSIHALLSWEPGALPFDEMLRGTTPLQASCVSGQFHHSCRQLPVAMLVQVCAVSNRTYECMQLCTLHSIYSSWPAYKCHRCLTHMVPVQAAPDGLSCNVCLTGQCMLLRMLSVRAACNASQLFA